MQAQAIASTKREHKFGEFDLLKAIAILGLPAVHLLEEGVLYGFFSEGVLKLESVIMALCILGPSIFMICMGFSMGGSRNVPQSLMKQGIRFLALGMILNVLRWLIPGLIYSALTGDGLIDDIGYCLVSDIYFFVGLFYIFYSLMRRLNVKTPGLILTSIVMLTVNTLLTPLTAPLAEYVILDSILGNLVYVSETSCFPLLSWAIFPSIGIMLGEVLKKVDDDRRALIMKRLLNFSPLVFISFLVFLWSYDFDILLVLVSPLNGYITDLPNVILMITLALFLFGALYYPCKAIDKSRFMNFMVKIATYIVPFYMLQWVLVSWVLFLMDMFGLNYGTINIGWYLVCVIAITGICVFVTLKYGFKLTKLLAKMTSFKRKRKKA
jgi:hypothetical protein